MKETKWKEKGRKKIRKESVKETKWKEKGRKKIRKESVKENGRKGQREKEEKYGKCGGKQMEGKDKAKKEEYDGNNITNFGKEN